MQIGAGPDVLLEDLVHTSEGERGVDVDACTHSRAAAVAVRAPDAHDPVTVA
ncbi:hypothetical protein GCM10010321_58820 [Streptomyces chartreusis]|nr:hypothetical protein GCM10010321_58820 [Streptomyces chartreusis]